MPGIDFAPTGGRTTSDFRTWPKIALGRAMRLPIRIRLTLVFALAMLMLIAALGAFLHQRLESSLDQSINTALRDRANDVAAIVRQSETAPEGQVRLSDTGESVAQVLELDGRIIDASPSVADRPLLTSAELAKATIGDLQIDRKRSSGEDPVRLLAVPVQTSDDREVVVVSVSLRRSKETIRELLGALLLAGSLAVLAASAAGYVLAAGALRPVERMRLRAAAISAEKPGARLPIPATRDELQHLGETLNEMLARLETSFAHERRLVADASHELRMPLALLRTELELALRRERTPEEMKAALRSASEETDRLCQLAEDLLVLARSDMDSLPLRPVPTTVETLLGDVTRRFDARARERSRAVRVESPSDLQVNLDAERVAQALGNLVENSLAYGDGEIKLRALVTPGQIELHVLDDGPGFPEAFLDQAFERFSRADEARGRGGTGLGLAIVRVIALAHGGSANAANRAEGGADVWLTLPCDHATELDRESVPSAAANRRR